MDVVPVLRTIRSVAPQHVEDGQRIEIARMQQTARRARLGLGEERLQTPCLVLDLAPRRG
jgi:hypothetical protein